MEDKSIPISQTPVEQQPIASASTSGEKKNKKSLLGILVILIIAIFGIGAYFILTSYESTKNPAQQSLIKVGLMMPFTGDASTYGAGALKGIQLAKKELGAENIELIQEDTKCDKTLTAAAVERLAAQGVVAIIGESCSGASLAALPEANKNKVVLISPSSSSPLLSIPDDYFFRVVPPDTLQGKAAAELVYEKGVRKVALLYSNEPYGEQLTKFFKERFVELGGTIVADLHFERDVIDLSKEAQKLKLSQPEAIYFVSNSLSSAGAGLRHIRAAGLLVPVFASEAFNDQTLLDDAKAAAEGLTITAFSSGTKAFRQSLEAEFGAGGATYSAPQGYDAFKTLYLAIDSGATTKEQVKEMIGGTVFDGVSGHISFDKNGEVTQNYKYDLLQVKNGKFVTLLE